MSRACGTRWPIAGLTPSARCRRITAAIAVRLGAEPGDPAMRTSYTFLGDGKPVMLSVSWEPAALTSGTAIMLPEEGPHAGQGVVERMAVIGQRITHAEETVAARPALASEAERLGIRPGGIVLTITRTYRTGQAAVETADIVLPAERYAVTYEIPVRLAVMLLRFPRFVCAARTVLLGRQELGSGGKPGTRPRFSGAGGVPGFPQCASGLVPPCCWSWSRAVVFLTSPRVPSGWG
jgi:hypothetical protein